MKNGIVYRLWVVCDDGKILSYVGRTTMTLQARISKHRSKYRRFLAGKINYSTSSKHLLETGKKLHSEILEQMRVQDYRDRTFAEREQFYLQQFKATNVNKIAAVLDEEKYKRECLARSNARSKRLWRTDPGWRALKIFNSRKSKHRKKLSPFIQAAVARFEFLKSANGS